MKERIYLLSCFVFVLLFSANCSSAQIIPGVGIGKYKLGTTQSEVFSGLESRARLAKKGLFVTFDEGTLTSIMITSSDYSTKEGLRVGDDINRIIKHTENLLDYKLQIAKGDEIISTDDNIIAFEGIRFIVNAGKINAILIVEN